MRPTKRETRADSARKDTIPDWVRGERSARLKEDVANVQKVVDELTLGHVVSLEELLLLPRNSAKRLAAYIVDTHIGKLLPDGRIAPYNYVGTQDLEKKITDVIWTWRTEKFREPSEKRIATFARTTQEDPAFKAAFATVADETRWGSVEVENILRNARTRNSRVSFGPDQFENIQGMMIIELGKIIILPERYQEIRKETLRKQAARREQSQKAARLAREPYSSGILAH
jgi:hypothetical protein